MSVAAILQALAENAGRQQMYRGAVIGNTISQATQIPAQMIEDRRRQAVIDREQAQREQALSYQGNEDKRRERDQTLQEAAAQKHIQDQQDWGKVISEAYKPDGTLDYAKGAEVARAINRPDFLDALAKHAADNAPKVGEAAAGTMGRYLTGPNAGQLVPDSAVPEKPHAPTGPELDQKAEQLYIKKRLGLKMTAEEDAALGAYEDRKRVISDPAASAAAERQATGLAAQVAQQGRAQAFMEAQAGRKELTDKVETPYQTALSSANTLRDVVAQAKAGNKVAGSLQNLETTMAAIRAQGLNRINMAEIGVTADAGNLWDHIVSYVGKKAEGQPVPENIQNDMVKFADVLEKAAYKKYAEGHKSITTRYGLKDEKPLAPPPSAAPPPKGDPLGLFGPKD